MIAPPPLIYLGALAIGFALAVVLGFTKITAPVRLPVGVLLVVAGSSLLAGVVTRFRRAHTEIDPYRPTTAIVTSGPFRRTRNPAYLGMALVYSGIAFLSGALWAFVPLLGAIAAIDRGVIAREERYLERKFGNADTDYKRQVRRWL